MQSTISKTVCYFLTAKCLNAFAVVFIPNHLINHAQLRQIMTKPQYQTLHERYRLCFICLVQALDYTIDHKSIKYNKIFILKNMRLLPRFLNVVHNSFFHIQN